MAHELVGHALDTSASWRQTRVGLVGSLLLTLVTFAGEVPEPNVEWSGNAACPGAEVELTQAVVGYLDLGATEFAVVEVHVAVFDAGPAGLQLALELESRTGSEAHELAAIDCEGLLDQAAVLIAGAIDPFAYTWPGRAEQHHRAPVVQRPRAHVAVPVPASIPEDEPSPPDFGPLELVDSTTVGRARPPISGGLSVGATGFVGVFPAPGGGVELDGVLERGRLRWQAGLGGWFGGEFRSTQADAGADLWALAFASALCGMPGSRRVRVPLCATAGVGFMAARAVGTIEARRDTQPWAWAGAEARVLFSIREQLGVGLGVGAMAALVRPAWEVQSPGVRFRVPPVMGVVRLTFETQNLRANKKSNTLAITTP